MTKNMEVCVCTLSCSVGLIWERGCQKLREWTVKYSVVYDLCIYFFTILIDDYHHHHLLLLFLLLAM